MIETNRQNIFVDNVLADQFKQAFFVSMWGTNTDIMALFADVTAGKCDFIEVDGERYALSKELHKEIARISDHKDNPYGKDLVHVFLYRRELIHGDQIRLLLQLTPISHDDVWGVIKEMSPIPLLDDWKTAIVDVFYTMLWAKPLTGYGQGLYAKLISIDDEFEETFIDMMESGKLKEVVSL